MFPEWTWIVGFWIGAAVGSFLNVVIYRLPRGLSIAEPKHSFCPRCKHRLTGPDLVPILSWLFLRGRCRHCREPVSPRYVAVEIVNGSLWAAAWWVFLSSPTTTGDPVRALALMLFCSGLVVAVFTDLAHYIIPDEVNAFLLAVGLGQGAWLMSQGRPEGWSMGAPSALAGAVVGVGALWGVAFLGRVLFRKDAMGHGDIKLARGTGAFLMPYMAVTSFGLAVALGAVIGVLTVLLRRKEAAPDVAEDDEPDPGPEPIGSLLKAGLGYLLCVDVLGLAFPKVYESWFGESPYATEEFEDEPEVELTQIPFGPYLAAGAVVAAFFERPLRAAIEAYLRGQGG